VKPAAQAARALSPTVRISKRHQPPRACRGSTEADPSRIKWDQAPHQHGHGGAERQHASRPAPPHRSPPCSPAHPTRLRATRSQPERPTTCPGTRRSSERLPNCRRAPPATRRRHGGAPPTVCVPPVGGPLLTALQEVRGAPQTCPQRLTQRSCQNSRWNVSSTWGCVGVEVSRETTCPPAPWN
jgi:hypothetical protein